MKGTMFTVRPDDGLWRYVERREMSAPPPLEDLQAALGGRLAPVPGFKSLPCQMIGPDAWAAAPAIAFAKEGAAAEGAPGNGAASLVWEFSDPERRVMLFGTVIILTGDREFVTSLGIHDPGNLREQLAPRIFDCPPDFESAFQSDRDWEARNVEKISMAILLAGFVPPHYWDQEIMRLQAKAALLRRVEAAKSAAERVGRDER